MRVAAPLMLLGILTGCGFGGPESLTPGKMFELSFDDGHYTRTVSHQRVEVQVRVVPDGDGAERTIVSIEVPGFKPFTRNLESTRAGFDREIGIGRISATDEAPGVILQTYTGGAHCCTVVEVVRPIAGKLVSIEFEDAWDGESMSKFPEDLDGDGTVDFIAADDAFNYQFSSYAGSWSPPRILNVLDERVVDVSSHARFRSLFESFSRKARKACLDPDNSEPGGACAGYVASEVRLGRGNQAFDFVMKLPRSLDSGDLPVGCDVPLADSRCPPYQEREFHTFAAALLWFLEEHGYVQRTPT